MLRRRTSGYGRRDDGAHAGRWLMLVAGATVVAGCSSPAWCSYPVTDPGLTVINVAQPAPMSWNILSNENSAFGELVPDGYLRTLASQVSPPVAALDVVADIQQLSACNVPGSSGGELPEGPVTRQMLQQSLPDNETLVVENVTLSALFNTLEHGVAGEPGFINSATGRFVLVSGIDYTVNCKLPPEGVTTVGGHAVLSAEGQRVVSLTIAGQTYARSDENAISAPFPVALPQSLAQGGDAYFALRDLWEERGTAAYSATSTTAFEAVASYLGSVQAAAVGPVTLPTDTRLTFENCSFTP